MLQQRQNDPSRKRQVKRDLATTAKKGVAGLRIDGTADPMESSSSSTHGASSSRSPLPAVVANNLISTIAATDAAIRIASDIIDSTLAHASADSSQEQVIVGAADVTDAAAANGSSISASSSGTSVSSRQDLLHEIEETLNISASGSGADSTQGASAGTRLDFFSQTIEEFRSLALTNIAESSSDSDSDAADGDDQDESPPQTETEIF